MQRLREMQSRSRTAVNRPKEALPPQQERRQNVGQGNPQSGSRQTNRQANQSPPPVFQKSTQPRQDPLKALFGDMKIDSEKALILLILFVLYKNKSDPKLLLALGYLLI